jgi:ABC-2 type transport system permease protein
MPIKLLYKDIKIFLSDKKVSLILILMPMILMTILGVAVGGMMKGDISPAKLAVVKKYKKEAVNLEEIFNVKAESLKNVPEIIDSEELFFGKFLDKTEVKKWLTYEIMGENEAKKLYEKGKIDGIIVLGENFYRDLSLSLLGMNKDNIQIELYVDQNNSKGIIV